MKKNKNGMGGIFLILFLIGLYFTNPTTEGLRDLMKTQKQFATKIASHLPIERTNFYLFSKFEIKYGIGKKTCWGAAKFVIICP